MVESKQECTRCIQKEISDSKDEREKATLCFSYSLSFVTVTVTSILHNHIESYHIYVFSSSNILQCPHPLLRSQLLGQSLLLVKMMACALIPMLIPMYHLGQCPESETLELPQQSRKPALILNTWQPSWDAETLYCNSESELES